MAEKLTSGMADLLKGLGLSAKQLQNAKLGPGVVGRNSKIGHTFLIVALAGVLGGGYIHSAIVMGMSLFAAFVIAAFVPILNVHFGHKNPAAAILEGAQFLQYQQIEMAAKGNPVIIPKLPAQPKPKELEMSTQDQDVGGDA